MAQKAILVSDRPKSASADGAVPFRQAPHNLEAEQALLGAILVNNEAMDRVSSFLEPHHFFDPLHGPGKSDVLKRHAEQGDADCPGAAIRTGSRIRSGRRELKGLSWSCCKFNSEHADKKHRTATP